MSEQASGSIADYLTFSERKTGSQVRWQKKQKDVITEARTEQRTKFSLCVSWWNQLNATEKQEWETYGNS